MKPAITSVLFVLLCLACLLPVVNPPIALAAGIVFAQFFQNPFQQKTQTSINWLLKLSVIGLGFGMNIDKALAAGKDGFLFTIISISLTIGLGILIGKIFKIDQKIAKLISSGTAICGGSAIAAISPIIKADAKQISIAIGSVFLLNSLALFLFPVLGHYFNMSQHQFGIWSAIAIHDTSSVVGAAQVYGNEALEIATTVKLARALWILPVSVLFAISNHTELKKIKIPYFIGLFILAIIANTYIPNIEFVAPGIVSVSKMGLTLVLFLIGSTLNYKSFIQVGIKPVILAVFIWIFISIVSLIGVLQLIN
ncbi:putative sulfate exporter family transporter [Zunongwangia sp. SCSIO 43204]|uniref:YeiH family protein n=1 Tax=Zunongwangia sp. SCSIO 43204 TaxID=2779359 RepID=UPI001CA97D7A|nr:putative sulfate exporter family transporter [Zunongwangia sp. SCSIO 43204]UAB83396.1 putative sulfate exporter family transporter [Zunongwangia sp. SCSIO 43204]